jgi:hypothetical protein
MALSMPPYSHHKSKFDLLTIGAGKRVGLALCVLALLWLAATSALT